MHGEGGRGGEAEAQRAKHIWWKSKKYQQKEIYQTHNNGMNTDLIRTAYYNTV